MEQLYLVLGIALIIITIADFIWTTLWVDGGAGPLTDKFTASYWSIHRKLSQNNPKRLSLAGPMTLALTLAMWIFLLWAGWTLVFSSSGLIVDTKDGGPLSFTEYAYFSGYLIFTLGNGEFSPEDGIWQIIAIFATGTGMLFITFGVTYLLQVLSAVTEKRALASSISSIADSPGSFIDASWNGKDFRNLDLLLDTLSNDLSSDVTKYNAYPVLHYYCSATASRSLPVNIVVLDEALSILYYGVADHTKPNRLLMRELRNTISNYLETLDAAISPPSGAAPPPIRLHDLNGSIPQKDPASFQAELDALKKRRKQLLGLMEMTGSEWPSNASQKTFE